MDHLPYTIHRFLTERRRRGSAERAAQSDPLAAIASTTKEYPRMPRVALPDAPVLEISLEEALSKRRTSRRVVEIPLQLEEVSTVLRSLSTNDTGSRRYPSDNAIYPIETYVLCQRVEGIGRGAYHYYPPAHALEHLWDMPDPLELFAALNAWADQARAIVLFTGNWYKNGNKYHELGYLLGLLETGHMAQNIVLAAAALEIPACPLAGFDDDRAAEILDLDQHFEQPVYAVALG